MPIFVPHTLIMTLRIDIVTLFPEMCASYCEGSIVGRAVRRGLVDIALVNPRDWAGGRHRTVDDRPYGGGPGMVMAAPPIAECLDSLLNRSRNPRLLMTSPQGGRLTQRGINMLAEDDHIIILCGHYEGIDERIVELYKPEEFSIGDFVLSGGELAALIVTDAVTRQIPGALGHAESAVSDSFQGEGTLLDHPCYTKPAEFRGLEVPAVLTSGDHGAVDNWRETKRIERTQERRPDLESE